MGRHGGKINALATDLNLLPVVQMAESLIHKKDQESVKSKKMLGETFSMIAMLLTTYQ